jgi:hypothetical protein
VSGLESGGTRWETKLMGKARMVVLGGRKDVTLGMRNPKENAPFGEYAKAALAKWATQGRRWPVGEVGRHGQTTPYPRRRFTGKN